MIITSVFYKLSEESYIRHRKLESSIMLILFSIVRIHHVVVGDSGFHYFISTDQTSKGSMMSSDIACCGP